MSGGANQKVSVAKVADEDLDVDFDAIAGFVTTAYDYVALTYVAAGNGVGEIKTATFRSGGSLGIVVTTLTLDYNASNQLTSVAKT